MSEARALLLTDLVDSTALSERLGDAAMARLWARAPADVARGGGGQTLLTRTAAVSPVSRSLTLLALAACGGAPDDVSGPRACNGDPAYCDRPFDELSVVCTHNAMSNEADGFTIPWPNQGPGFTQQLDDGVRCMMLDTWWHDDQPWLCHGACGPWGERSLVDGLGEIQRWLTAHPDDVLSFVLEANISEAQTLDALEAAGLGPLLHHHDGPPGTPWPTLGELVDRGERLVVFTDDGSATEDWHLDWREHGWETPFDDPTFTCANGRGDPTAADHQVFILNHYTLCEFGGCAENGVANNAYDTLLDRAQRCSATDPAYNPTGKRPTFVNLDQYHVPVDGGPDPTAIDALEVMAALNAPGP